MSMAKMPLDINTYQPWACRQATIANIIGLQLLILQHKTILQLNFVYLFSIETFVYAWSMSFSKLHIDIDHHCTVSEQGPWLIRAEGFVLYGMQSWNSISEGGWTMVFRVITFLIASKMAREILKQTLIVVIKRSIWTCKHRGRIVFPVFLRFCLSKASLLEIDPQSCACQQSRCPGGFTGPPSPGNTPFKSPVSCAFGVLPIVDPASDLKTPGTRS